MTTDLLGGIRILDLTNVLAGPFSTYQLSLMGAQVVKVEIPLRGDLARQLGADEELNGELVGASFLAQNAGKKSVTLDLKHPRGPEVFRRMVVAADVLVENFRPGVLGRLGFPWHVLHTLNPRLIYCALSGFGQTGPMRHRPAYDQVIQGLSGMMSVTGSPETAPLRVGFPVCDTIGGLMAAFAITSALVGREHDGIGRYLDVSMLESAAASMGWILSDYLIAGREHQPMANENATAAPSGTFDTGSGKINISANQQKQFEDLCRAVERPDMITDPRFRLRSDRKQHRNELRAEFNSALRTRSAVEWEEILSAVGIPAARILSIPEVARLPQLEAREFVTPLPFPGHDGRMLSVVGNGIHVDGEAAKPATPPPLLGEHTDEVLTSIGFKRDELDALHASGAL